jgi:hypothetical protein
MRADVIRTGPPASVCRTPTLLGVRHAGKAPAVVLVGSCGETGAGQCHR